MDGCRERGEGTGRVRVTTLACGPVVPDGAVEVGPVPGKAQVDPLLDTAERLVVLGTDADLAAVVLRLLRTERLETVSVGFVPAREYSAAVLAEVSAAQATPVPLVRDDVGGVLVSRGTVDVAEATVYCDSETVLRGAGRLEVRPGGDGVLVRVRRRLRRAVESTGRAVQIGSAPTVPVCDGVPHPRPVRRWTWYRHTSDLLLVHR